MLARAASRLPRALIGACLAAALLACTAAVASTASAADLGGNAEVRRWSGDRALRGVALRLLPEDQEAEGVEVPRSRVFRYFGGAVRRIPGRYGADTYHAVNVTRLGSSAWCVAVATTSRHLVLRVGGNGPFRVRIGGRVSRTLYGEDFRYYDLHLRFGDARQRTVVVELSSKSFFRGARLGRGAQGRLLAPRLRLGPRTIVLGDSYTEGQHADAPFTGYVQSMAHALGLADVWASGLGGTGFVNRGTWGVTFGERVGRDVIRYEPATVIVTGGINDIARYDEHQIVAGAERLFAKLRRGLPRARIVAVGPWFPNQAVFRKLTAIRDGVRAAAESVDGVYVDNSSWITGFGTTEHPTGQGNGDRYIGPSVTYNHPTQAGYDYLGRRLAQAIEALPQDAGLPR